MDQSNELIRKTNLYSVVLNLNMNKLDYLSKKEEELRKLNEQLEAKNREILDDPEDEEEAVEAPEREDDNEYQNEEQITTDQRNREFEESNKGGYTQGPANGGDEDPEFSNALSEVEKYREVLDKKKELERTVEYQRAKIEALKIELD
jgi:hypothetical protein